MGCAHHRHPPRRRPDARQGTLFFSPRTKDFEWDYKDQPPEFWNQFTTSCAPGEHVRVQALLDWSERDMCGFTSSAKASRFRRCISPAMARTDSATVSVQPRLLADFRAGGKRRGYDRRHHRRTRHHQNQRTRRPRAGSSRAQRHAKAAGKRIHVIRQRCLLNCHYEISRNH